MSILGRRSLVTLALAVLISSACGDATHVPDTAAPAPATPTSAAVAFLHAQVWDHLQTFEIDQATGSLSLVPDGSLVADAGVLRAHPSGRFLYDTYTSINGGPARTVTYRIQPNGRLELIAGSAIQMPTQNALSFEPSGKYAFVVEQRRDPILDPCDGPGRIHVYAVNDETGALAALPSDVFSTGTRGAALAVVPSGAFGYVASPGDPTGLYGPCPAGSLEGYAIDATSGNLTPVPGSPFAEGVPSRSVVVTNQDAYVIEGTYRGMDLTTYSLRATDGRLTFTRTRRLPHEASGPLLADPQGRFLFVSEMNYMAAFVIDPSGDLREAPGSPLPLAGSAFAADFDPWGRYLYVAITTWAPTRQGFIHGWVADANTGALTPVPGSPFLVGSGASALAISRRR
jgi:6-phosphogluconolactonase